MINFLMSPYAKFLHILSSLDSSNAGTILDGFDKNSNKIHAMARASDDTSNTVRIRVFVRQSGKVIPEEWSTAQPSAIELGKQQTVSQDSRTLSVGRVFIA